MSLLDTYSTDKLSLWSDNLNSSGKRAKLVWSIFKDRIRVTVFANEAVQDKKLIYNALFRCLDFGTILQQLRRLVEKGEICKYKIVSFKYVYVDNRKTDDKQFQPELMFGIDTNKMVWISLVDANNITFRFTFRPPETMEYLDSNGNEVEPAVMSKYTAISFINLLETVLNEHVIRMLFTNDSSARKIPSGANLDYDIPDRSSIEAREIMETTYSPEPSVDDMPF